MEQIRSVMKQMIDVSECELNDVLSQALTKTFKRQEILSQPNTIPTEIFFVNRGLIRVLINDNEGNEHTIHFALENQFIADYSNFIQKQPNFLNMYASSKLDMLKPGLNDKYNYAIDYSKKAPSYIKSQVELDDFEKKKVAGFKQKKENEKKKVSPEIFDGKNKGVNYKLPSIGAKAGKKSYRYY